MFFANQAVMSLFATGRLNGLVVDSGESFTYTVPIFEGYQIPHSTLKMEVSGRATTNYAQHLLEQTGLTFTTDAELEIVRDIKERFCYVA